jgi:hypothetical protein
MDVGGGRVIDQQAEQFGRAVVPAGIHERLALINQAKVKIGYHRAFAGPQRVTEQLALWGDDCGEAATRYRAHWAACVGHDLLLLVGIQPRRRGNHEDARLERMVSHLDFSLLREQVTEDRSREHRRMDLLAVGDERVPGQRVVVLPTRQLTNATHRAVDGAKSAAVALASAIIL